MAEASSIQRVALVYNPFSELSIASSHELAQWLREQGFDVRQAASGEYRDNPALLAGVDLLVALGGDGTVLRAARLAIPDNIPVLAIALGHLSFMAELDPEEAQAGIEMLQSGHGWYDRRTLIDATLHRADATIASFTALNEVAIARSDMSRIVNVDVTIDGLPLTTYHADGVLIATATGSTAYALAAGGPILDPRSKALALVPIAAHLTSLPSMVLHEDAMIGLRLNSCHHASLAIDGRENIPLQVGDFVIVRRSYQVCTFVRVQPINRFYAQLVRRLRRD